MGITIKSNIMDWYWLIWLSADRWIQTTFRWTASRLNDILIFWNESLYNVSDKISEQFCLSLVFEESCNYVDKEATHWFLSFFGVWRKLQLEATHWFLQYQRNGRLFLNTIFFIHLLWYDNKISMSAKSTPPIYLLYYLIMSGQLAFTFFSLLHWIFLQL